MINALPSSLQRSLGSGDNSNHNEEDGDHVIVTLDEESSSPASSLGANSMNSSSFAAQAGLPPLSTTTTTEQDADRDDSYNNDGNNSHNNNATSPSNNSMNHHHHRNHSDGDNVKSSDSATQTSSNYNYSDSNFLPYAPRHSDFTIPTSNQHATGAGAATIGNGGGGSNSSLMATDTPSSGGRQSLWATQEEEQDSNSRRSIFGNAVQRKYKTDLRTPTEEEPPQLPQWGPSAGVGGGGFMELPTGEPDAANMAYHIDPHHQRSNFISDVSLPDMNGGAGPVGIWRRLTQWIGSLTSNNTNKNSYEKFRRKSSDMAAQPDRIRRDVSTSSSSNRHLHHFQNRSSRRKRPHETIHAQSLLLGLAFCAVWSANNVMAPNLTEMADFFGLQGAAQRDLYLGSYCALATGVFSFPISAGIGVLADLMSRQRLFCITVAGGGIAALITAQAQSYPILFATRLINGGFMAGSTPVAFSFLGDLFSVEERNAASSGLTAMMGLGIIMGQVYAGMMGPSLGWQHPFYVSGFLTLILAVLCLLLVQEPERGGKEKVLQDMIRAGTRYDRKLTWAGFLHAVRHNKSNSILLWQGFFSSLPWGVIFVFLNDFLSQERGFSVPQATYLVLLFGLGCAAGGVLGGYWGQLVQRFNRSYLPIFMSVTTLLGILPFIALLNSHFTRAHSFYGISLALTSGLVASLPSVNVRPCLINVNPPETRGASLTAANLLISLGRGVGPSCVTLMGSFFQTNRALSINLTLVVFWIVSAVQLALLARTLPKDQDLMEAELASYARAAMEKHAGNEAFQVDPRFSVASLPDDIDDGNENFEVSIEDRMTYFDGTAARQTFLYVKEGFDEFREQLAIIPCAACGAIQESSEDEDSPFPTPNTSVNGRLDAGLPWGKNDQKYYANEKTPLIV